MSEGQKRNSTSDRSSVPSDRIADAGDSGQSRHSSTVLLIAYHFPPAAGQGLPGTQRAMKLVRYLPDSGWKPIVLTVTESSYPDYILRDPTLLSQLSPDLIVERTDTTKILDRLLTAKKSAFRKFRSTKAKSQQNRQTSERSPNGFTLQSFKDGITELFQIPDEVSGWIIPAARRGHKLIRREKVGAIIATGRPWSSLVVGYILSKRSGLPLISDFRDPWMTNPFRQSHSWFKNMADGWLERRVVKQSAVVIANTESLKAEFASRYKQKSGTRFVCIPNGFDETDLACHLGVNGDTSEDESRFTLVHSGFLYGRRNPKILVDAIAKLAESGELSSGDIRVDLVGPRELPYSLREYIDRCGVSEMVRVIDAVPYAESLHRVARSSLAILLQPGTVTQVPSKLFENVGLGKMTLAIANQGSATAALFGEHDLGFFANSESVDDVMDKILEAYRAWKASDGKLRISEKARASFDVRSRVRQIADELETLRPGQRDS